LLAAVLLHAGLVLRQFPMRSLREGHPLTSAELSCHLAHASEGHEFLAKRHRLWGYSNRYMAGYPFGLWNSFGKRGYEFAPAIFPMLSLEAAYYLWIVLSAFLPPVLMAWAGHVVYGRWRTTTVCFLLAGAVYHLGNIIKYPWTSGMIAYVFGGALAALYGAYLYRAWSCGSFRLAFVAGITLGVTLWVHPFAALPAALATLAVPGFDRARARSSIRAWLCLGTALAMAGGLLLPWLLPLWAFRDQRIYMSHVRLESGIKYLIMDVFSDRRYRFPFDRRPLLHVVLVLAAVGSMIAARRGARGVLVFTGTAAGLFLCAYFFAYSRFLEQTQPYRFLGTAKLFALVPAALGLEQLWRWFRESNAGGRLATVSVALMLAPSLLGYGLDFVNDWGRTAHGLDEHRRAVVAWLQARRDRPGRVLVEDWILGNVVPYYTGQEVIGGTMVAEAPLLQSWPRAGVEAAMRQGDLERYLDLYNVAFVIAQSPYWREAVEALEPRCRRIEQFGPLSVFECDTNRLSYLWNSDPAEGATVKAEPNRIVIEAAPAGRFVIKYHYLQSLKAPAGVHLFPQKLLEDPAPFIGVDNPAGLRSIVIDNAY